TDFGVAKAVSDSTGGQSLTSMGVALGTPAYMAPEQAAANPHIDHRADIYALGAMAYEMLCGRPPFDGPTPQAVLSAQVTQQPEPMTMHRSTIPVALNELVMRCLAKLPADRWQNAEDLKQQFEVMVTPSGGVTPTGTQPVISSGTEAAIRQAHPVRVAGLFGLAAIGVLALVYMLVMLLGLPNWVMAGAVVLLAVGLPIMMLTGHHERRRAMARTIGMAAPTPTGMERHFTWRKAILGGGVAFAGLGVVSGAYMAMRLLGIGPVGTLIASGAIPEAPRVVLADFVNRTADSTLGPTLTEALRVDLSQSPVLRLMDGASVDEALARMGRGRSSQEAFDQALALELARREGAAAVVVGELGPLGQAYVISARLLSAENGAELFSERQTAEGDAALIGAVDALSAKLRERIGESLRSLRAQPPLEQVTTASLEALRKFTAHFEFATRGEPDQAIALLREAVAIDTAFAMAYRRLAVLYSNTGAPFSLQVETARRAFQFRDRLGERERLQVTAYYHSAVFDGDAAIRAYRELLDRWPDDNAALNNLSIQMANLQQWEEAERLAQRAMDVRGVPANYMNLLVAQLGRERYAQAESTIAQFVEAYGSDHPIYAFLRMFLAIGQREYAETEVLARMVSRFDPLIALPMLVSATIIEGRLADGEAYIRRFGEMAAGRADLQLGVAMVPALVDVLSRDASDAAIRKTDVALEQYPLANIDPLDRPYLSLAYVYAMAGRTDRAREILSEMDRDLADVEPRLRARRDDPFSSRLAVDGHIALAESRPRDAIEVFRAWREEGGCAICGQVEIGRAYDMLGEPDSALAAYQAAVNTPFSFFEDLFTRAPTLRRIGELYEERDDTEAAVDYYNQFVQLWQNADAELQPQVEDVRGRIARLVGERR
ncbi:MAG: protein kinase, partial [Gemmatimonadales bacterium]